MKRILSLSILLGLICLPVAQADSLVVENGKTVKINYILRIDDKVIDTSKKKGPLEFVQGEGKIIRGLTDQLEGLKVGDKKIIIVSPSEGYGEMDPTAIRQLPKASLPEDYNLKLGDPMRMKNPNGTLTLGIIWEIREDEFVINFNHPLAGKTLEFDIEVVSVK